MTATPLGWSGLHTGDSLGAILNALASGATAESAAIDNTEATLGQAAYDTADLFFYGSAGITPGSGSPYIQAAICASDDGTNYDEYGVSNSQLFPVNTCVTLPLIPSTARTVFRLPGLIIPPTLFKVVIYNLAGVALATTVTASLYRYQSQAG
jgi:hypothetical protein